ncbi:MAG: VOC family protein [Ktedonobacteraceae bacterium]
MDIVKKKTPLAMVSVFVDDQDEALQFYIEKLGLEKRIDVTYGPGMRWVTVAPKGQFKPEIALAKPDVTLHNAAYIKELVERVGHGVAWMFDTDNCCQSYETLLARGVTFITTPTKQLYGVEAVFSDPYGNIFSLLEPSPEARSLFLERRVGTAA